MLRMLMRVTVSLEKESLVTHSVADKTGIVSVKNDNKHGSI